MTLIEGRAEGELDGLGRWTLTPDGARTHVRYDWIVEVTKPWMRLAAPLLRPVFAWNHGMVMRWGYEGLTRKLAARCRACGSQRIELTARPGKGDVEEHKAIQDRAVAAVEDREEAVRRVAKEIGERHLARHDEPRRA